MQHHHRLASDVNLEEEVELQRLEGGTAAARLSMRGSSKAAATNENKSDAAIVRPTRDRGPSVTERRRAEELTLLTRPQHSQTKKVAVEQPVSDGKSKKTGFLLARAKLSPTTGGVVAAQQRRNSLLSKGKFRDAEKLAREAAVGSLNAKEMPKRKDATTQAKVDEHAQSFRSWMQRSLKVKVRTTAPHERVCQHKRRRDVLMRVLSCVCTQPKQANTAASYEKMALTMHEWMVAQGYEQWAHVVEVEPQRYRLELLADEGTPRVPTVEAVVEFLIGMSTGDVEKGGSREARSRDWYATPLWGKSQAEMFMREELKGSRARLATVRTRTTRTGWGASSST